MVDIDLEKFFDRVNHDVLMARVARRIKDKRMLRLIRRYLQSGIMEGGLAQPREEGTPQGGPLSPLLSNILLDDLDKELEKRSHCFCRYADDCNIYVRTRQSGERVLASLKRYLEKKLRLKVNEAKSRVDRPWNCKFLGDSIMTVQRRPRLQAAVQSVERFKVKARQLFRQGRGRTWSASLWRISTRFFAGGPTTIRSYDFETFRGPRPLDTAQTALPDLAALGTGWHPCAATDPAGVHEAESVVLRLQRARPVVECRVLTHERRLSNSAFERMGLISIVATVRASA